MRATTLLALAGGAAAAAASQHARTRTRLHHDNLATAGGDGAARRPGAGADAFTYKPGYLAAGDDLPYNGLYTYADALAKCSADEMCFAFTFNSADMQPTTPVNVYFKSATNYVCCDASWSSYVRTPPPAWPAVNFTVAGLAVGLRANSHSVQVMRLVGDPMPPHNFSWVPPLADWNRQQNRGYPGCHQLGDVTLRVQPLATTNASAWALYGSAYAGGAVPATPLPADGVTVFASDDITALLNATPAGHRIVPGVPLGLRVTRSYERGVSPATGADELVLRINLTATADVRVGGFGFSLPADDITDTDLAHIAYINSLVDPHIGGDHGWAEWSRIVGNTTMLVVPGTPATRLEAWRPLLEDCGFEGTMAEWTVLSGAWAAEWATNRQAPVLSMPADLAGTGVWGPDPSSPWPSWWRDEVVHVPGTADAQWLPPSVLELRAGEGASFALRFTLAPGGPRTRDATLAYAGEPVLSAVPGYTLGTDMEPGSAFLLVSPPHGQAVAGATADPPGVCPLGAPVAVPGATPPTWRVPVTPASVGACRAFVNFTDGSASVAHLRVLPPFRAQVAALGAHWANTSWLPREYPDPFGRSAAVLPWDREDGVHVLDDSRAYIVGLSDDAGAGNNLGFATKVAWAPTQFEVSRVDEYIANTLYGTKPDVAKPPLRSLQVDDQIRMTMYFYCQTPGNCTSANGHWPYAYPEQDKCSMPVGGPIWCMTENMADATYRGYNVPHSTAVWLGMYRVARFYDRLTTAQPWSWYLERAFRLAYKLGSPDVGLMDGTVFRELLLALREEGTVNATIDGWASQLEQNMKDRADGWAAATFPYGSEFNYDTTGQEEVYVWLAHFGHADGANRTLDSVLGYMRAIPNWAWHGGARSIGDLGNNGKYFVNRGTERVLMHYRAGLNQIPLLEQYRAYPDDAVLLGVAVGAISGQMANIDPGSGAPSMGFHSFPFAQAYDPRSGDYGLGFFGGSIETGAYLVRHPLPGVGWACYLCNLAPGANASYAALVPTDGYGARVYLEPLGLHLVADAGVFAGVAADFAGRTATLTFAPAAASPAGGRPYTNLRLRVTKASAPGLRPVGSGWALAYAATGAPVPTSRGGGYDIAPPDDDTQPAVVVLSWTE